MLPGGMFAQQHCQPDESCGRLCGFVMWVGQEVNALPWLVGLI